MSPRGLIQVALVGAGLFVGSGAIASTWNWVAVGNDEVRFFFDADTIEKTREATTVWVKLVRISQPDSDASWATALRWRLNCTRRTIQTLAWSSYDRDGKFIKSNSTPSVESAAVPDSTGEALLKIACEASFPRDTSSTKYFKLEDNDVYAATKRYVEYQKSQVDLAPK